MMRRYHRWLSVVFGLFILWIASTGAIVQFSRLTAPERPRPPASASAATSAPKPGDADEAPSAAAGAKPAAADATRQFIHFVTELHSGEEFGKTGQIISLASGLALVFFALSGLWMYIELFRRRLVKVRGGGGVRGGKWFWR